MTLLSMPSAAAVWAYSIQVTAERTQCKKCCRRFSPAACKAVYNAKMHQLQHQRLYNMSFKLLANPSDVTTLRCDAECYA